MRIAGSNGQTTQRALRRAAIELISQHGYHGISLRLLAEHVGLQAGSLYNHIKSKQDLLFMLLKSIQEDLVVGAEQKVLPQRGTLARLTTFVKYHIEFHTSRKAEVFIGNMELRSLEPENLKVMIDLRKRYELILRSIVLAGMDEGIFDVTDAKITTFAILGMLNAIPNWYDPKGELTIPELQDRYVDLVLNMLHKSGGVPEKKASRK
jgi:AcrR family transcriptional regulator